MQDPQTLYKLIILYMLQEAALPLSRGRIRDFILEKGYTNYIILNQSIAELLDSGMIKMQVLNSLPHLSLTGEGEQTLSYFKNNISEITKAEVRDYLKENKLDLRNEISVTADYYKSTTGEYEARLLAKEKDIPLVEITLSVPAQDTALAICDNWRERNEEIYQFLVEKLFS